LRHRRCLSIDPAVEGDVPPFRFEDQVRVPNLLLLPCLVGLPLIRFAQEEVGVGNGAILGFQPLLNRNRTPSERVADRIDQTLFGFGFVGLPCHREGGVESSEPILDGREGRSVERAVRRGLLDAAPEKVRREQIADHACPERSLLAQVAGFSCGPQPGGGKVRLPCEGACFQRRV
jgi:hypothetical protein